jgi:putative spermidine/putrescine transport system substrate-binding protein
MEQARRRLLKTGIAGAAGAAAFGFPSLHALAQDRRFAGKTLRILTWSDDTGLAVLRNIAQPFEALTGARVIADRTGSTSEMVARLKATGGRPQYDVITLASVGAVTLAMSGLLEKPDLDQLPNLSNVDTRFRTGADGYGIGYLLWTGGLLYNTRTFKAAPASYEEMWNPRHAKRLFLPPATWTDALDTVVAAAKLEGGGLSNAEAGFKRLEQLKDRVLTFGENPTQLSELFRTNALDIGGVYAPAFFAKQLKDPNSGMGATYDLKEGFFADLMYTVMPKARPGESAVAHAFINYTLDAAVQGRMAEDVLNGPVNQKAVLSPEAQKSPYIVKPEQLSAKAVIHDRIVLAKVREGWIKRYTQTFA